MAKITTYRGSVSLVKDKKGKGLNFETIIRQSGPFSGMPCIVLPVNELNPAIYLKKNDDGSKVINLDIEVRPTPQNQYGNSHYIRLHVGKENRQKYNIPNEKLNDLTPIVGNLKEFSFEERGAQGQQGQNQPVDDLPPATPQGNPPAFDPSW